MSKYKHYKSRLEEDVFYGLTYDVFHVDEVPLLKSAHLSDLDAYPRTRKVDEQKA